MQHEYIGLDRLLSLLGGEKQRRGDEYICRCPAHDDQNPSLWIKEGETGIVMKCRANKCTTADICRAIGIKESQLFFEPKGTGSRRQTARTDAPPAPQPAEKPKKEARLFDSYEAAYGRIGKLVKVYPYTDKAGNLLFEVARIMLPDGDKTFRQHRPAHPERGKFPIVCNVPQDLRHGALYRLPEVSAAIREGRPVYVVEGEKDADTLASLGCCATTCPGGAKSWTPAHSERLAGADVIVVPDNDAVGEEHGQLVAETTLRHAKRVRLVRLVEHYPQLPPKGDITDLAEMIGKAQALELLMRAAESTRPVELSLYQQALDAYRQIPGYCVANGCICQSSEDGPRVLGTFVALPIREVIQDDGELVTRKLEIAGWASSGAQLETLTVDMDKYTGMSWAPNHWGLAANIMPGTTIKDKLRAVITTAGAMVAKRHTIYQHTGWRKIGGKWVYLYGGGCVGAEDIEVQMENKAMGMYTLGGTPEGLTEAEAAMESYSLIGRVTPKISVPLLGLMYLAPLRQFLDNGGNAPAFMLMLKGRSLTHKSTVATLFLSHFGDFNANRVPASFQGTGNSVRRMAFLAKDMPLLIDDYHPVSNLQERRKMESMMQTLARAFGNNADRMRMSADRTLDAAMPPRSVALITGEELPDVGESAINRLYVVGVEKGDIPINDDLTELQRSARRGTFRAAMRGYISWLCGQADGLSSRLDTLFEVYRKRARETLGSAGFDRAAPALAHIMIGLTLMMYYFEHLGLVTHEDAAEIVEGYWEVAADNCREQAGMLKDEKPVQMYLRAVKEMLASKALVIEDLTPGAEHKVIPGKKIHGYMDAQNYYFIAGETYGAVVQYYAEQNRVFSIGMTELHRMLVEEGVVRQTDAASGKKTKLKRINNRNQRVLWIPRVTLDTEARPEDAAEQVGMDLDSENPFTGGDE